MISENKSINNLVELKLSESEKSRFDEVKNAVINVGLHLDYDESVNVETGVTSRRMWAYTWDWSNGYTTYIMVDFSNDEWIAIIDKFLILLDEWVSI